MLTFVLLSCAFLVLAVITFRAWWGDGRTDLRRCPRCWYDMSATAAKLCPECGHTARSVSELYQRRASKRVYRGGLVGMSVLVIAGVFLAIPGPWTAKVPRPLMRLALFIAAAPPGPPVPTAGMYLPTPNVALLNSRSAWDRLVWQQQASIVFDAWASAVLATEGPITDAELARLVPMVDQVNGLFALTGGLSGHEAWNINATRERLAAARSAAKGDADRLLRIEWSLAEMQYTGGGYSHRPDFARVSDAIIRQALNHADSHVRVFGMNSVGRRAHEVVTNPTSPMPYGRDIVEGLATSDPVPGLRRQAADLVAYMDSFLPKK